LWKRGLQPHELGEYETGFSPGVLDFHQVTCILQVTFDTFVANVGDAPGPKRRSGCPVSISLDIFGDRWSLLIIRDLMVRGFRMFKEFEAAGEGIATNILADRLQRLKAAGIITEEAEAADRRCVYYRLTEKGIDLAPVLLDLLVWGSRHEEVNAPCAIVEKMAANREQILAEVRQRWEQRDPTPVLPWLSGSTEGHRPQRKKKK
jgi:DNA-binding HxlR family transcriptional regulator